jgi:hypothetical protein
MEMVELPTKDRSLMTADQKRKGMFPFDYPLDPYPKD